MAVVHSRRRYADGKPKPAFRGALHAVVAGLLVLAVVANFFLVHLRLVRQRWGVVAFCLGKLASYGTSASLHRGAFCDLDSLTAALRRDLAAIPLSVGANSACLARTPREAAAVLFATAVFFVANLSCVDRQLEGAVGLDTPRGDAPRQVVLAAQCAACYAHIYARRRAADALFLGNVGLVLLTLALSAPVSRAHAAEPVDDRVPWHRRGAWGYHEDMHVVLLVGDATMFLMVAGVM